MSVVDSAEVSRRAGELFDSGLYCAESVLKAMAEAYGLDTGVIPRIATGLCGGVSRTCGECGAVNGAILGLGLLMGRDSQEESAEDCYAAVQSFKKAFEDRFGSTNCRTLTGCDLGTDEGQRSFVDLNLKQTCSKITEQAAGLAVSAAGAKLVT